MKLFFATGIHQAKLKISKNLITDLRDTILKLPEVDASGAQWSKKNYHGGYTSYGSLSRLHVQFSIFDQLKKALDLEVKSYTRELKLKFPRGKLVLSSLWANIMPAGCYHAFHFHPNSVVSGTFYVSVPKGTSPLRIEDPRATLFMASPPRQIQMDLNPVEGDVILFESWLRHEVPPHSAKTDRLSVSFNYDWIEG